jgi:hypothetical protein
VNPREEWVTKEVPELRIIDQPLWDAVKARQTANAVEGDGIGMWDRRRPRHLLSGLMVCGECGGGYSKVAQSRFGCSSARNKGESVCRNKRTITCDAVDNVVLHGLQEHLMAPELVALFCEEYLREANRLRREAEASLDDMKIALAKVQREQARLPFATARQRGLWRSRWRFWRRRSRGLSMRSVTQRSRIRSACIPAWPRCSGARSRVSSGHWRKRMIPARRARRSGA